MTGRFATSGSGLRAIPGDDGPPLIGHTIRMMRDPIGFARDRYARYGPISRTRGFGMPLVGVTGPEGLEAVLANRDKAFANGPAWSYFIGPFFHRGIMLLDFDEHLHHRRIMQQAFTTERLRDYLAQMNEPITDGLRGWGRAPELRVYPALKSLLLDVASGLFMGGRLGAETDEIKRAFVDCVRAGTALVRFGVPGLRWSRGLAGRRVLESFFAERITAKREGGGDDLFSALCAAESEDGHRFSDADVVNHMIFLLMAAHDTTTITLTSMSYYLAKHPEWQQRCRDEVMAIGHDTLEYDDLDKLPSVDLVMKEALRLVPPVPALPRRTVADTEVLGHFLPEGITVMLSMVFHHRMPQMWSDPDSFDPDRFAPPRREDKVHRYAWTPFGGGVHKCIGLHFAGLQAKALMHQLLRSYRWSVDPGYTMPIDWTSLPSPKDGLPVRIERIS